MEFSGGTVGNTSMHHLVAGAWQGPANQSGPKDAKLNVPLCDVSKRCGRVVRNPNPDSLCLKCARVRDEMATREPIGATGSESLRREYTEENVRLGDLFVDRGVQLQRPLQDPWADKIAGSFSWPRFNENPPKVSARLDGRYHIMDGQHQVEGARRAGYGPDTMVRVYVWRGLDTRQEAELFNHQQDRHGIRALAFFHTKVTEGAEPYVSISRLLEQYGWQAASAGVDGHLAAVTQLERIWRKGGEKAVDGTLCAVTTAWGLRHKGADGRVLAVVGDFIMAESGADPRRLGKQLAMHGPEELIATRAYAPKARREQVKQWYNANLRGKQRLP